MDCQQPAATAWVGSADVRCGACTVWCVWTAWSWWETRSESDVFAVQRAGCLETFDTVLALTEHQAEYQLNRKVRRSYHCRLSWRNRPQSEGADEATRLGIPLGEGRVLVGMVTGATGCKTEY